MTTFFDEPESDVEAADEPLQWDEDFTLEPETSEPEEIPEYVRIKVPTKDNFMSLAIIYNGKEEEHVDRGEHTVRWLTDKTGEPYRFDSKEEARVFLAKNVKQDFIRPTDRALSIEAYEIDRND